MSLADNVAINKRLEQLEVRLTDHVDHVERHFKQLGTSCAQLDGQLHSLVKQIEQTKRHVNFGSEIKPVEVDEDEEEDVELEIKTREDIAHFITQMNLGIVTGHSDANFDYSTRPRSTAMELEIESSETSKMTSIDSLADSESDVIISQVSTPPPPPQVASNDDSEEQVEQFTAEMDQKLRIR